MGDYNVLYQEAAREIKSLDIVLPQQGNLKALLKKGKKRNIGKRQRNARAKVRLLKKHKTRVQLLNNRASLPRLLERASVM